MGRNISNEKRDEIKNKDKIFKKFDDIYNNKDNDNWTKWHELSNIFGCKFACLPGTLISFQYRHRTSPAGKN